MLALLVYARADWQPAGRLEHGVLMCAPTTPYGWSVRVAAGLALLVVVLGVTVRLSDAGLGCPDWPGCYGHLTVSAALASPGEVQARWPDRPLHPARARIEMIHRDAAACLGFLILAITAIARQRRRRRLAALALLGLVVLQALVGMVSMLPVTHGVAFTHRRILAYAIALLPVSLMPCVTGLSGVLYAVGALLLGLSYIRRAWDLLRGGGDRAAMALFGYSITYLSALFALLLADRWLAVPWA